LKRNTGQTCVYELKVINNMEEDINKIFKKLQGQIIQKFSVKTEGAEQYFYLITDKAKIKFIANDLDAWIEEYEEVKKVKNKVWRHKI